MPRLRILNYSWHAGHQYELYKLPHDFTLIVGPGVPKWKFKHRPLNPAVACRTEDKLDLSAFDAAICHFDERMLDSEDEQPMLYLKNRLSIPIIAICHGTPPFTDAGEIDLEKRQALIDALGDTLVIVNSHTAGEAWGFKNYKVIWHGFDIDEYPKHAGGRGILYVGSFEKGRQRYQGKDLFAAMADELPCSLLWTRGQKEFNTVALKKGDFFFRNLIYNLFRKKSRSGYPELSTFWKSTVFNPYAKARFEAYKKMIRRHNIYLNPTRWSPMPRARTEAMLSGLAIVTTNYQDEERFIENEVDGFYTNDAGQMLDYLKYVWEKPEIAEYVGRKGREKASQCFSLKRFHEQWEQLLREQVG